jgi:sec-independent protein translocase protein TatA
VVYAFGMPGIGVPELIIVLVILLIIFGPKRLPGLGRSLGSGMKEFKDSITGKSKDEDDETDAAGRPALNAAEAQRADEPASREDRIAEPRA